MEEISLIYVNYYTSDLIHNSVKSFESTHHDLIYEIIIVDNSCSNDELYKLQSLVSNKTKIIDAGANLGFGSANNLGRKAAKYNILFFVNPDTIFIENSAEIMLKKFENRKYNILGCNLITKDFKPNYSFNYNNLSIKSLKKENSIFKIMKRKIKGPCCENYNYTDNDITVGYVSGAALAIRTNVFDEIGGFDEDIFMYSEDDELCFMAQKKGYSIINTPSTKIVHLEGGSFDNSFSLNRFERFVKGGYIYFLKCYGESEAIKYLETMKRINIKKYLLSFNREKKIQYLSRINILKKFLKCPFSS